jgi:peptidoglycan-N-acetylglucosamine deacetylase
MQTKSPLGLISGLVLLLSLVAGLSEEAFAASAACPAGSLGTERTLALSTKGGFAAGLKTYPQTLALADHEVVLTFDDGPSPMTTPAVLAALAHECVKATFFLIGREAEADPALVRREVAEGHTVGHHTYSHPAITLRLLGDAAARADIEKGFIADDRAAYGKAEAQPRVPFFRFPGFADTPALVTWLEGRDVGIFGADLWASDWLLLTPEAEFDLVLRRLEKAGRGILLMHDSRPSTAEMLPKLLRALKERGFKIVDIVPGDAKPQFHKAPPGWTSETEAIIAKVLPKLRREMSEGQNEVKPQKRHAPRPNEPPEPAD